MNKIMKKLAIIGANESLECFYKQAKKLGYYLIGIAYEKGAVCKKYCDKFYPISFADKDSVLEVCKTENIDGITSFSLESALPTVIYVAQNMGLVSNSFECAKKLENKFTMRKCFTAAGIPNPLYKLVKTTMDLDEIDMLFPCIVKPVDSGGSQGVTKVNDRKELHNAFQRAIKYSKNGGVIIEQFVDGREFSVEYISHNGNHYHLQITDKVTSGEPYFVELAHHQPAQISVELMSRMKNMVEKALTVLDIENSASHTEIKLDSKGDLYIIEVGARMGGDYITSDLVRLSTGYDFVKGVIDLALDDFETPQFNKTKYSGVYFYSSITPFVKEYIQRYKDDPVIVEFQINKEENNYCYRNGDRNGYFIYQCEQKLIL
ncbi:ATP-grasp domain-containing protein [Butyricimonas virosa]|jgi:phosphoribosylglycinamide synthetase, ATP-grasp (A) domain|uniref:ATP-grasp domain-containing protein n=2 Tax=Butyricimonas virosa TaxID=544645 RepID=A0A413INV3_9BACT|nr:ATP-grasp domain-containing protein [Butyricimonas virosa]RHI21662.1 ATP-grasp domain-containing protein [Butyricimonas virosa]